MSVTASYHLYKRGVRAGGGVQSYEVCWYRSVIASWRHSDQGTSKYNLSMYVCHECLIKCSMLVFVTVIILSFGLSISGFGSSINPKINKFRSPFFVFRIL